jgi:hypothetical protein
MTTSTSRRGGVGGVGFAGAGTMSLNGDEFAIGEDADTSAAEVEGFSGDLLTGLLMDSNGRDEAEDDFVGEAETPRRGAGCLNSDNDEGPAIAFCVKEGEGFIEAERKEGVGRGVARPGESEDVDWGGVCSCLGVD